jgi:hypothetical protein
VTRALRVLYFAVLVAVGTRAAGWWIVPVLAAVWVRVDPRNPTPVLACMLGAALGWAMLLGLGALTGPVDVIARRAAGVMDMPPWELVLATLLFSALLAGAAALGAKPSAPP